ncbi:acetylornithine transaminase [Malassezia psittaci]|uniref:Acetylornithine transaminase n=1 Tax=Malassezia psittaci TaxID=1821823 RepID=A0AAF0F518_9BASI|nr:acetylornithine transaminase [Malassezia psittaci]
MSSATLQEVRKSLLKLAQSWPKDPLRPNLDFGEAIRTATESELANVARGKVNAAELRKSLESLERLRGNECLREYPTPRNILHPASSPQYYTQLVDAMGRVASGQTITPSWSDRMRRFFNTR